MRDGYEDYARFLCHVKMKSAEHDSRCEIVTGRYFSENLKKGVRDNRCSGLLFSFSDSAPSPINFKTDYLTNITNKKISMNT